MEQMVELIDQWNASRLELFRICRPDQNNKFYGVMRFFYESKDKYHSKCVRVSSEMSVKLLLPLLWDKFSVLTRRIRVRDVRLYERCGSKDKLLGPDERPLLIQLCWCQDDREGIFVLKSQIDDRISSEETACHGSCADHNGNPCLSKYCDVEARHSPIASACITNSYLSRTISNPESMMRHRRKTKLESKLQQIFRSGDENGGGTLKIYGESINPMIPYKSLLLSIDDTAEYVVREILDKYGLEQEDANDFCLVKLTSKDTNSVTQSLGNDGEEILQKTDCPLKSLLGAVQDPCFIKFKVIKCPPHLRKRNKAKHTKDDVRPKLSGSWCRSERTAKSEPKREQTSAVIYRPNTHLDSGIESQQSCTHSATYPSNEQLPIYDLVNNNVYSTPPFASIHSSVKQLESDSRPLPSYEESVQRSRFIKSIAGTQDQRLSPFRDSFDSFSFSSDCMEDLSYNIESVDGSVSTANEGQKLARRDTNLSVVSDLDAHLSSHLPVQITYFKSKEDLLLDSMILDMKPSQVKFKLSLAYVLHLMVVDIIRLTCINKTTKSDQELIIGNFIEKVTSKIRQSIKQNRARILMQTFWLANCTEFLYLLKNNPLLSRLNKDNFQRFYELFADNTQCCFQYISCCFKEDVMNTLPVLFIEDADDDDSRDNIPLSKKANNPKTMSDLVRTLTSCMSVLQQCHVNPALIIQIMSRTFHLINWWIFNKFIDNTSLISKYWALVITSRVDRIRRWSAAHDLLMAADCYLQKCIQMCRLIIIEKTDVEILYNDSVDLIQINSVQLRHLLENSAYDSEEPRVPQIWIDFVASGVSQVADKIFEEEGADICLREKEDLNLPLLLPDDGYHVDALFGGIPEGFIEYLDELHREWCFYKVSHQNIHFDWLCQKVSNKEVYVDPLPPDEVFEPEPPQHAKVPKHSSNSHNRHQLKLSDFKGDVDSISSGIDTDRMQRYFQVDQHSQENILNQETICKNVQQTYQSDNAVHHNDNCSTYASSFSTEVVEFEDPSGSHEERLQTIREAQSSMKTIIDEDIGAQEQLQSMVVDLNHTYDMRLKDLMVEFSKEKSGDQFRMNYRQLRLAERRDEVFQKYRKQKESDSSLQSQRMQIISDMETQLEAFNSNTFPSHGSRPPLSFVSTSLALRNTLNYPPKIKPKPRTSDLSWRGRSQSVVSVCHQDPSLSSMSDLRPRSKSSDRYYSVALNGMENLSFREKLDMFEYGVFSTSH